jgi:hypothetical protein
VVTSVKAIGPSELLVSFSDGERRIVDLRAALARRGRGVFAQLRDPELFEKVGVSPSGETVVWPNGADIDPEVLYGSERHRDVVVRPAPAESRTLASSGPDSGASGHGRALKA